MRWKVFSTRKLLASAVAAGASGCLALAVPAQTLASPTIELIRGSTEPVESITTQLGMIVHNGENDWYGMRIQPAGGEPCAANFDADNGEDVTGGEWDIGETDPLEFSSNWTFQRAGDYKVCAWVTPGESEHALAAAETTFHVRQPRLALSISVPPSVSPNQTFQVATTAQAETERSVWEYALPNTGDGCPANSAAAGEAPGAREVLTSWNVTGGPATESRNESIESPGVYLFCAYFEYPSTESPPELSVSAQTTVLAPPPPCVVPAVPSGAPLTNVEAALRSASCSLGAVHYSASTSVRPGGVLGLNPGPGTTLPAGASVGVDVSAGRPCVVPSVRPGTNVHRAEVLLAAAHCGALIVHAHSRRVRRGAVIALGSHPHAHLFPLTRVRVIVSSGR